MVSCRLKSSFKYMADGKRKSNSWQKGAFKVSIKLRKSESLFVAPTSPHSVHKGSIESPLTPDTIHYFQAWNTHRSMPRGQNEKTAYLYKYAVLLRHVTCTCTPRYAPGILNSPRGSHWACEESGTCYQPPPPAAPPLWPHGHNQPLELFRLRESGSGQSSL